MNAARCACRKARGDDGDVRVGEGRLCGWRDDELHVLVEVELAADVAVAVDINSHEPVGSRAWRTPRRGGERRRVGVGSARR